MGVDVLGRAMGLAIAGASAFPTLWSFDFTLSAGLFEELLATLVPLLGLLSDPIRRGVLRLLVEDEASTREALTRALADVEGLDREEAARLRVAMHHIHLPKLDDEQYIDYDPLMGDVVLWADPDAVSEDLGAIGKPP